MANITPALSKFSVVPHRLGGYSINMNGRLLGGVFRLKKSAISTMNGMKKIDKKLYARSMKLPVISTYQKQIIALIRKHGFTLKYMGAFGSAWWLHKNLKGGYMHSFNITAASARKLITVKIIERNKINQYGHHIYRLTSIGKRFPISNVNTSKLLQKFKQD